MSGYGFAIGICVFVVGLLFVLLRTRRLREKYAAIWAVVALAVCVIGAVPRVTYWLADLVGVQTPVNLVFSIAFMVLLTVCIQLSVETSNLEEETRTVAEELALLRLEVHDLRREVDAAYGTTPHHDGTAHHAGAARPAVAPEPPARPDVAPR